MTAPTLDSIRNCFEGLIPSFLATCDAEGVPNVSEISQVQYVDPGHVALSYQFFNKTRRNLLATRAASITVIDPDTNAQYRLDLEHIETQTSGPVFEAMRAKLSGIASHYGMQDVFRLLGSDIFRVRGIETVNPGFQPPPGQPNLLSAARRAAGRLEGAGDLEELFERLLDGLEQEFGVAQAMVLMLDPAEGTLFTVASRGYPFSGVGSEIGLGEGVIGVAAAEGVPIRVGRMSVDHSYGAAIRESAREKGVELSRETAIPFPGLAAPSSQIALPIRLGDETLGVLFAESEIPNVFRYEEEDAMALVAVQLGPRIRLFQAEPPPAATTAGTPARVEGPLLKVRHFPADNAVFIDHDYLIKGVAGAILWRILSEHAETGRTEFTNLELRRDPALRLPQYAENLEARLLLLQRRLRERGGAVRLERCGRGRLCLSVAGRLELETS